MFFGNLVKKTLNLFKFRRLDYHYSYWMLLSWISWCVSTRREVFTWVSKVRDGPLKKWWGVVERQKKSCKGGWLKKKSCIGEVRSELHSRAYKVFSPKGYLDSYFILKFKFLGPGVIPIHLVFFTIRQADIFFLKDWYILCAATSSRKLLAKHPCRNPHKHGLNVIKNIHAAQTVFWNIPPCRNNFTTKMYKWRLWTQICTPAWWTVTRPPEVAAKINVGQTS